MLRRIIDGLLGGARGVHSEPAPVPRDQSNGSWHIGNPGARHPYEVTPDHPVANALCGMMFQATLQTRTPLRILRRHGQVVPLDSPLPDDFELWMGMWAPKVKPWRELGFDMDELPETGAASDAGPVKPSEYLPFLIAVREAIEDENGGTAARIKRLEDVCSRPEFIRFVAALRGAGFLRDNFFPPVLSLIPGLPTTSQAALKGLGLCTVTALQRTPDETLLAVSGIGPAKLRAIREFCAGYDGDPGEERAVNLAT